MRIRLTDLAIARLAAPANGRKIVWDALVPGLGVRLTANGAKSWIVKYWVRDKQQQVMETLGSVALIPTIADARDLARASIERAERGENPVQEKRAEAVRAATNTVTVAAERYLAHCDRTLKPKTAREWRRIYEHDVLPRWGERQIAEITKTEVLELVNDKAAKRERKRQGLTDGAAVQAGKMLTRLRTFFGWAAANDLVTADPTAGVRRPAKEASRDRVLRDDEIAAFWIATERFGHPFGPLLRLLLLTAQRESEVAGLQWPEIEGETWTIPGNRAKNGKPHIVPLCALAVETIEAVPHIAGQSLLFSHTGITPVSGWSKVKQRLDVLLLVALREAAGDDAKLEPWVLHDLRRTATTGMARLGIAPHVADRVLNHTAGTIRGVAAIYNRFEYLDERRAALEAWGREVERLIGRAPPNVVRLRRRR